MSFLYVPPPNPYRPHLPTWRQPLYLHLEPLWHSLASVMPTFRGRVLDVGCGLQPYRQFLDATQTEYVGVDRIGPLTNPTVVGAAEDLPFEDESFDVVLSTQVLEHLPDPLCALREATRVLRRRGRIVLTVPGVWPTHEAPYDFWRFTRYGLSKLLQTCEIEAKTIAPQGRLWATVGQMINLELSHRLIARQLVPVVNLMAKFADSLTIREDLVMNWFVDGTRQ